MKKIFFLAVLTLAGCATDEAAKLREENAMTVGLLGVQYRPRPNMGVGVGFDIRQETTTESGKWYSKNAKYEYRAGRNVTATSKYNIVTPYVNFFPWTTSAFFLGGGVSLKRADVSMKLETEGTSHTYEISANYLRFGLGWNWIWENGFSLFLDFGFPVRMSRTRSFGSNKTAEAETAAEAVDDTFFAERTSGEGGGSSLIGISFPL